MSVPPPPPQMPRHINVPPHVRAEVLEKQYLNQAVAIEVLLECLKATDQSREYYGGKNTNAYVRDRLNELGLSQHYDNLELKRWGY